MAKAHENTYATKPSDGQKVNFGEMSVSQLYELHFLEESFAAKEALGLPPFSKERSEALERGYRFITELMKARDLKEYGKPVTNLGSGRGGPNALVKLAKKKLRQNGSALLCEIGVGAGRAISAVLDGIDSQSLEIVGCDIAIDESLMNLPRTRLVAASAYDFIKGLPDGSVDILYSDNVFEHFCPDEAPVIYAELAKKLAPGAALLLVIPNRLIGPFDISGKFLQTGEKAKGFHFMEMTFGEVAKAFAPHGIRPSHCALYVPKIQKFIMLKSRALAGLKLRLEGFFAKMPKKLKFFFLYCGGYHISAFAKKP